jgi:hypothetical protein
LSLFVVEPLQPGVRIIKPPTVQRVAAIRIASRRRKFQGAVELRSREAEVRAVSPWA